MKREGEDSIHKPFEKDVVIGYFEKCPLVTQEYPNKVKKHVKIYKKFLGSFSSIFSRHV